jgi:hypothetical protein
MIALKVEHILEACEFPPWKMQQILSKRPLTSDGRKNSASYKIFKKYGWNKVDSGWSSFF